MDVLAVFDVDAVVIIIIIFYFHTNLTIVSDNLISLSSSQSFVMSWLHFLKFLCIIYQ